jgi:hypothetical protein
MIKSFCFAAGSRSVTFDCDKGGGVRKLAERAEAYQLPAVR